MWNLPLSLLWMLAQSWDFYALFTNQSMQRLLPTSLGIYLYTSLGVWQVCTNEDKPFLEVVVYCVPTTSSDFSQRNLAFPSSPGEQIQLIFELPQGATGALPNFHQFLEVQYLHLWPNSAFLITRMFRSIFRVTGFLKVSKSYPVVLTCDSMNI